MLQVEEQQTITYPPKCVQFFLSQTPHVTQCHYKSPLYKVANCGQPQYFDISSTAPCARFAHLAIYSAKQINPVTENYQICIKDIQLKGVQLSYLAHFGLQARNFSRISTRLTRSALLGYPEPPLLRNSRRASSLIQLQKNKVMGEPVLRSFVTNVESLEQTMQTCSFISVQHHLRHGRDNLSLVNLNDGSNFEVVVNQEFVKKWL